MADQLPKIITTEDGSHTLYMENMNETYHSFHGACQESNYVFIKNGLEYLVKEKGEKEINLLEVGFGTGLNAILTLQAIWRRQAAIDYQTLETNPLPDSIIKALNYAQYFSQKTMISFFDQMHKDPWNKKVKMTSNFMLEKHLAGIQDFNTNSKFNLVYFDAFAPDKQPELWTLDILRKVADLTLPNGILVTYCAKGQFKRDLKAVGYGVETLPGPPGKKEMVRALKL